MPSIDPNAPFSRRQWTSSNRPSCRQLVEDFITQSDHNAWMVKEVEYGINEEYSYFTVREVLMDLCDLGFMDYQKINHHGNSQLLFKKLDTWPRKRIDPDRVWTGEELCECGDFYYEHDSSLSYRPCLRCGDCLKFREAA